MFMVNMSAINPKEEERRTPPIEAVVDTGAELSWLPKQALLDIGIVPRRIMRFTTADGNSIEREVGYAILTAEGYDTIDEVVFAEKSDYSLLGVRTIEGFSVMVDNVNQRFVAAASCLAPANFRVGRVES
jgi:predicted aspartyl protease